jgi:ribosome-associated toxin RatA of RatAB toxin-antitoxin module
MGGAGVACYIARRFFFVIPERPMEITRSALVPHSALDMYRLVHDVRAYPEFLSWCAGAEVLEESPELQLASLQVLVGGVSSRFTTRNRLERGERLVMALVDGPFQRLAGEWRFEQLGEDGSKISLDLAFEFSSRLMSGAFSQGFSKVADRLVRDFSQRADSVYRGG